MYESLNEVEVELHSASLSLLSSPLSRTSRVRPCDQARHEQAPYATRLDVYVDSL